MQHLNKLAMLLVPALTLASQQAMAYIGPGMGAGTLGVLIGLIGSVLLALFAFFWYPIKRMFAGKDKKEEAPVEAAAESPEQADQNNSQNA